MDEIEKITEKYKPEYIGEALKTLESLNQFALIFFQRRGRDLRLPYQNKKSGAQS